MTVLLDNYVDGARRAAHPHTHDHCPVEAVTDVTELCRADR
ncbi:MAG: hypothetical protein JWL58_4133 [Streptosporangiaceae bacterium]|jgi:hypothetical protein|nr:hypothetical protein [Streptosporangiaceae bacterium]